MNGALYSAAYVHSLRVALKAIILTITVVSAQPSLKLSAQCVRLWLGVQGCSGMYQSMLLHSCYADMNAMHCTSSSSLSNASSSCPMVLFKRKLNAATQQVVLNFACGTLRVSSYTVFMVALLQVVTANCDATTATAASTTTLLILSLQQVFSELVPQGSGQLIMLTRAEKEDKDSDNSDSDAPQDEMTASSSVPQNVSISAYIAASMCYSEWSA
eukprot:18567-Heterococcus_DN1.PRE.1